MSDLYKRISNPININTIDELLNRYCNASYNFYNALVGYGIKKDKEVGYFTPHYKDKLEVFLFDAWKTGIIDYCNNIKSINCKYQHMFLCVGEYLKDKQPKTAEEVRKIINFNDKNNKELTESLDFLRWTKIGEYSSWEHIDSSAILVARHERDYIEHRLYINSDSTYTHQIAYELVKRCHKKRLRYYFKYDDFGNRDDTIVIYCSSKNIGKFIDILNEIKRDLKLDDHIHNPPFLSGKIDGWIGYGSHPEDSISKKYSFNSLREKHLEKCISKETIEWMKRNINHEFTINGKKMIYRDYIIKKMVVNKKKRITKYLDDSDKTFERYGYRKRDIESREFTAYLTSIIRNNFGNIMRSLENGNKDCSLKLFINNKTIYFGSSDMDSIISNQIPFIQKVSTKFRYDLLDRIRKTSSNYGIDPDNYAFDISRKGALIDASKDKETYSYNKKQD